MKPSNTVKKKSQADRLLEYLQTGRKLMRLKAWDELGILEAPARISELRRQGHLIKTKMITVQNRFGDDVRIAEWSL